jgi:hypothetical protein
LPLTRIARAIRPLPASGARLGKLQPRIASERFMER